VSMGEVRMVHLERKKEVFREAYAEGFIKLRPETIRLIKEGRVKKGDVIATAKVAAIMGVKKTWELIPLCHPIRITGVDVEIDLNENAVRVAVKVTTVDRTGVEMEALTGVSMALLTIWDMVKAYEKDEKGQYPHTRIYGIRVISKVKRNV